ncbi:MAG: flagellar M-ring protein FliF [Desulfobulbaceae bacterium]|nr:flagellar M-ring protein FliF [Desulfobulbaceae bacterium]
MAEQTETAPQAEPPKSGLQILAGRIKEWPLPRKLALVAVTLISVALFAVIILQARTADYQLLYSNLGESDAASIVEWLKGNNTPYQLTDNGLSIRVPTSGIHEIRLQLASAGLPQGGGVGFEIFDKQSFALTDFVQKVNYTRALQGELARTIASLKPVETARVHLALPEKRLFKNQQKPATASVIVNLKPGRQIHESQIQGIVHLVSSSIEGLSPDDVVIIDQNGNVLTRTDDKGLLGSMSPDMLEFQLKVEKNMEERAQSLLDKALGLKNSMVRVTASLDFSQFEKTEELFDPEEPVIRSEQVNEEKSGSEIVGGVPGVQSNLQGASSTSAGATPPSSRSQRTTNYEISKVISKTINPVGTVQKISVSVLVADKIVPATREEEQKSVPRTETELLTLEKMISSALGLDKTRGDKIEITSMPFIETAIITADEGLSENMLYTYMPVIRYGILLLAGLLIYFLMIKPLIKTLRTDVTQHYKTVQELEKEQAKTAQAAQQAELEALMRDPVLRIREAIQSNPVFAAHILKNWLHEKG